MWEGITEGIREFEDDGLQIAAGSAEWGEGDRLNTWWLMKGPEDTGSAMKTGILRLLRRDKFKQEDMGT